MSTARKTTPTTREYLTCPHCWHKFAPEDFHYVATSPQLAYDHVVPGGYRRFLPSKFDASGNAVDPGGGTCSKTACPRCHLEVPRILAILDSLTFSVIGAPGAGKSYFLASMIETLSKGVSELGLQVEDVDAEANQILTSYQRELFQQPVGREVRLMKTDVVGDWYSRVELDGREKQFPKPFLFKVERFTTSSDESGSSAKVVCFYDNAGESFEPGSDTEESPVTRHMAEADGLLFIYDPTQEPTFCVECQKHSDDPQWTDSRVSTQGTLFTNAVNRIRDFKGMLPTERLSLPLFVVLPKFDAWKFLLDLEDLPAPFTLGQSGKALDLAQLADLSQRCRKILGKFATQMLMKFEGACDPKKTFYIPMTATGCAPTIRQTDDGSTTDVFIAGKIVPQWAEVPLLSLLHNAAPGLVPVTPA
jgi:hypothetical protein